MGTALRQLISQDPTLTESNDELADVVLDASHPICLPQTIEYATKNNCPVIIATTNYNTTELAKIKQLAQKVPVLKAANFSLGVAVLNHLVKEASKYLQDGFDIEIVEKHHNQKIDAPSGTAKALFASLNTEQKYHMVTHREGKREADEVGVVSLRGGSLKGEHSVYFFGQDETIELRHEASSRDIFANGMLKCAKLMLDKAPKLYTINEILFKEV